MIRRILRGFRCRRSDHAVQHRRRHCGYHRAGKLYRIGDLVGTAVGLACLKWRLVRS